MATALAQYEQFNPSERKPKVPACVGFGLPEAVTEATGTCGYITSATRGTSAHIAVTMPGILVSSNTAILETLGASEDFRILEGGFSGTFERSQNVLASGGTSISESNSELFDVIVQTASGQVILAEVKCGGGPVPKSGLVPELPIHRGITTTDLTAARIRAIVERILSTIGPAKLEAQESAATIFARTGGSVVVLDRIVRSLVDSHRSGAIDDAVDVLALIGRDALQSLAKDAIRRTTEESPDENYWYALIRSAGRLGDRETIAKFIESHDFVIQEAVVEALSDIGDANAAHDLKRIAEDTTRPESIRSLAQELASDMA